MRRPCADREEKRVTHGRDMKDEEQLDSCNPNQRGLLALCSTVLTKLRENSDRKCSRKVEPDSLM